jgi:hypothetical protein
MPSRDFGVGEQLSSEFLNTRLPTNTSSEELPARRPGAMPAEALTCAALTLF